MTGLYPRIPYPGTGALSELSPAGLPTFYHRPIVFVTAPGVNNDKDTQEERLTDWQRRYADHDYFRQWTSKN